MKRFKYLVIEVDENLDPTYSPFSLDQFGYDGWEIIKVVMDWSARPIKGIMLFKKELYADAGL